MDIPVSRRDRFIFQYPPFATMRQETAADLITRMEQPADATAPFQLYVHLPFCRARCAFCYYNVVPNSFRAVVNPYLDALHEEIDLVASLPALRGRPVQTCYFGGGTPTYLKDDQLRALIEHLRRSFDFSAIEEFTCEAESTTVTPDKLSLLKALGVTRVSFGIQAFDREIALLNGRIAKPEIVARALRWATDADFRVLNIDLMSACLGETMRTWRYSLDAALAYEPEHLTIYRMEVKPGTRLYALLQLDAAMRERFVSDDDELAMWRVAEKRLATAGYRHDAAFAWIKAPEFTHLFRAKPWQGHDLIGLGESAFGYANGFLYQNVHHHRPYRAAVTTGRVPVDRAYRTSTLDRMRSYMIMGMKLLRIGRQAFLDKFGTDPTTAFPGELATLEGAGALRVTDEAIEVTERGCTYVDSYARAFFPPEHLKVEELCVGTPAFHEWGDRMQAFDSPMRRP
jgi:oxygen-independent coproporphyrinogen-3 oxidase